MIKIGLRGSKKKIFNLIIIEEEMGNKLKCYFWGKKEKYLIFKKIDNFNVIKIFLGLEEFFMYFIILI